jgi:hypothetical protein
MRLAIFLASLVLLSAVAPALADRRDPYELGDYAGNPDLTVDRAKRGDSRLDRRDPGPDLGRDEASELSRQWSESLKLDAEERRKRQDKMLHKMTVSPVPYSETQGLSTMDVATEYGEKTFEDSDFGRHDFIDLLINSGDKKPMDLFSDDYDSAAHDSDSDKKASDHKLFDDDKAEEDRDKDREKAERRRYDLNYDERVELMKDPPPMGPNSWVPDKPDPLQMGAFSTEPDNGSPVPYRLNGHVDLERELPWLHDDLDVPSKTNRPNY